MSETAVARLRGLFLETDDLGDCALMRFRFTDGEQERLWWSLLEKAVGLDYAIELRLIEYDGYPNATLARAARKERRRCRKLLVVEEIVSDEAAPAGLFERVALGGETDREERAR
jgi:hypothetical protein